VKARLSTDGGSRGNPGPAAYGYVLEAEDGTVLDARGDTIGVATKVKSPTLRELVDEAQALAVRLGSVRYTAVRREHNELADRLVNEALDSAG
jgi:ribonuclease HI